MFSMNANKVLMMSGFSCLVFHKFVQFAWYFPSRLNEHLFSSYQTYCNWAFLWCLCLAGKL